MIAAALWLVLQGGAPTVGDTLWLSRTVAVPPGRTLRPADWRPDDPVELLSPPRVTVRGDSADVVYLVVIWRSGTQVVQVPGPLLLGAAGGVDSLPPERITLRIASVLPDVPRDSSLAPQPRADFVPRGAVSLIPLLVSWAAGALLLAPLHWWWRRRGPPAPACPPSSAARAEPPVVRWADAGEPRAVAATVMARLRGAIALRVPAAHRGLDTESLLVQLAAERPDWPLDQVAAVLHALDQASFGVGPIPDILELSRGAGELEPRLTGGAA
jgi:hypothetical protein